MGRHQDIVNVNYRLAIQLYFKSDTACNNLFAAFVSIDPAHPMSLDTDLDSPADAAQK